ncbi:hypothetical protein JYT19_00895 [Sulfobacillus acidophilus]|uniref:Major facilitator superfamily (MFS) profile domain-containing protein n=1 Tax=Sulfobacillus acidophilus TaxID=53633 RepID=A0ABS3AWI3_9FIRM|nr:hypothetical protein [Sulfobacillus acidophilus]
MTQKKNKKSEYQKMLTIGFRGFLALCLAMFLAEKQFADSYSLSLGFFAGGILAIFNLQILAFSFWPMLKGEIQALRAVFGMLFSFFFLGINVFIIASYFVHLAFGFALGLALPMLFGLLYGVLKDKMAPGLTIF